jgi:hypothetical protein
VLFFTTEDETNIFPGIQNQNEKLSSQYLKKKNNTEVAFWFDGEEFRI